jgi:GH15 family glucan-1,4-alpha-glucosidase
VTTTATHEVADIDDYALLGDTRTAALVSRTGAIDWMCAPRFDGPSLFGCLVGGADAGTFVVRPPAGAGRPVGWAYESESSVMRTTWSSANDEVVVRDGLVARVGGRLLPTSLLVREVRVTGAPTDVDVLFDPRFGPRRQRPAVRHDADTLVCSWGSFAVALTGAPPELSPGRFTRVHVEPEQPLVLALSLADREPLISVDAASAIDALARTDREWRAWAATLPDLGPLHARILRSLLTLRLLTYAPSGAPVAAPTTSLPEQLGGSRNWDYRYAWPRDASLGVAAFLDASCDHEAEAFMYWLLHAGRLDRPRLPVVLGIDGRPVPDERALEGWPGYRGSAPVRVGNGAATQHQLDVYGWVLDAGDRLERSGHRLFAETWRLLRDHATHVAGCWRDPDSGIWEVRGEPRHYVHSKLMAWTALDRALALARTHRTPARRSRAWGSARDALRASIMRSGYDRERQTFVRSYDDRGLDAALALVGVLGFEAPDSPPVVGTLDAIQSELGAGGPLLYRYRRRDDGLDGDEGAFLPCSFWLAHALAAAGRVDEAETMLEDAADLANDVGLLPEEIDPASGRALGNHPQALSHSSFVRAAIALRHAQRRQGARSSPSAAP